MQSLTNNDTAQLTWLTEAEIIAKLGQQKGENYMLACRSKQEWSKYNEMARDHFYKWAAEVTELQLQRKLTIEEKEVENGAALGAISAGFVVGAPSSVASSGPGGSEVASSMGSSDATSCAAGIAGKRDLPQAGTPPKIAKTDTSTPVGSSCEADGSILVVESPPAKDMEKPAEPQADTLKDMEKKPAEAQADTKDMEKKPAEPGQDTKTDNQKAENPVVNQPKQGTMADVNPQKPAPKGKAKAKAKQGSQIVEAGKPKKELPCRVQHVYWCPYQLLTYQSVLSCAPCKSQLGGHAMI